MFSLVILPCFTASKTLLTLVTLKGQFSRMRSQMHCQIIADAERFITVVTLKRLLSCMNSKVNC